MSLKEFTSKVIPIKDQLYRFSLRIVGNVAEAEDVVQEVLIKLWSKQSELAKYNNLEAWCMKMTKNLSIDKLRSKHRRVSAFQEGFDLADSHVDPHRQTEINDSMNHIQKLMQDLPEKQRMVMELRDIEGLNYKEIAELLDISLNQVKVNLFRARQTMRTKLINQQSYGYK